jgi:2-oxoglutarate dehydrogenase E2 component (dihydrolipoamide succinyltransferase)
LKRLIVLFLRNKMATPVKMPQLGESVVEGTISCWLKEPGDTVDKLDPLLEISTDKIDTEVPAPASGTLLAILNQAGETVKAGTVLAYIGSPGEALPDEPHAGAAADTPVAPTRLDKAFKPTSRADTAAEMGGARSFISPVVARMAAEHEVDLSTIPGSGLNGRITKRDMQAYLAQRRQVVELADPMAVSGADTVSRPLSNMRRMIADHMTLSKRTSPHVTTIMEVDVSAVVRHRAANRRPYAEQGIALTYMAYFMAATALALKGAPAANSRFNGNAIVYNNRVHIGMAVAIKEGLLVPVIRNADELNLQGMGRAIQDLVRRARDGRLGPDELQGGTFTVTNHGTSGSLVGTPIINQPQAGILGIGSIIKRPIVISSSPSLLPSADDAIVIRPMCYLSFSFDHRILDGAEADKFVSIIKSTLENWQ